MTTRPLLLVGALLSLSFAARGQEASSPQAEVLRLLEAWDIESAAALVADIAKSSPDDRGTLYLQGRVAFELGDYDKAVRLLHEGLGDAANESRDFRLAVAAQSEAKGTVVEESEHFSIRYHPGKDAALVPYTMETLESAWAALTRDLGFAPPGKVRVEIYRSPAVLAKVSSLTEEAIRTSGTIALCKYNRLMVTSPRALWRGYDWQDTLTHEFVHLLLTRASANTVPIWIHEGIAKYLETRWRGPAGLALDSSARALLVEAVKNNRFITFEQMHPSMALLPSQEDAALAFAEVFTAMRFVDRKFGMAGIRKIVDRLKGGATDQQAVGALFGGSFGRFEKEWKADLAALKAPTYRREIRRLVFREDRPGQPEDKERIAKWDRGELGGLPDPKARRHAHLGELLRARNRMAAAAVEFEKAIALVGPTNPALARKYAITVLDLGKPDRAEQVLRASLEVEADDDTNHLLLTRVLVESGRAAEAREHLEVANRRNPFDRSIHVWWKRAADALGDVALSRRESAVLQILAGSQRTWNAPLPGQEMVVGYVRIEAPPGAAVIVDGIPTGLTTPVAEHPLPAGEHLIRLEKEGMEPIERSIVVVPDELVPFPAAS